MSSLNGFAGNVQFTAATSATNLNATYAFSTNPVVMTAGGTGTTTLTLYAYTANVKGGQTLARLKAPDTPGRPFHGSGWYEAGGGAVLAGLLCLFVPRRRRIGALLLLAVSVLAVGVSGCGEGTGTAATTTTTTSNAAAGTYTLTIAATGLVNGVNTTHTSTVTFTVN